MVVEPLVIDIQDALNRAMGDAAFLQMMFAEFQQMAAEMSAALSKAVAEKDMPRLAVDAHQFKGAAANLGAVTIASTALALEKIGKSGNPAGAREAFVRMQEALDLFNAHLSRIDWSALGEK